MSEQEREEQIHTVSSHDTLSSIALRYHMSTSELRELNRLKTSTLYTGQILYVLVPKSIDNSKKDYSLYTVRDNDTLSIIALDHACSVSEITELNKLASSKLENNQILLIPIKKKSKLKSESISSKILTHTVQEYESLKSIARYYNITIPIIMEINQLQSSNIRRGQKINIINNRNVSSEKTSVQKSRFDYNVPTKKKKPIAQQIQDNIQNKKLTKDDTDTTPPVTVISFAGDKDVAAVVKKRDERKNAAMINKIVLLIPHCNEKVIGTCSLYPDKLIFEPKNEGILSDFVRKRCPKEILMKELLHAKVVERSEIIHSGYSEFMDEIGKLEYIILMVEPDNGASYLNYYIGIEYLHSDAFCYKIFQFLCNARIEKFSKKEQSLKKIKVEANDVGFPKLNDKSEIFREDLMSSGIISIRNQLPDKYKFCSWTLAYSTDRDGISMRTFYRNLSSWKASLMFIEDLKGHIFGAFSCGVWKTGESYVGSGESFLFQLYPETQLYPWFPNSNSCFMLGKEDHIEMGAGGSPGLWLDKDFNHGYSGHCSTFCSPPLGSSEDFTCTILEVWSFQTESLKDYTI